MATPALRALREQFGKAHICYLGRKIALETLRGTKWADQMLCELPRAQAGKVKRMWQMSARVRSLRADMAVLMTNSFRTALVARLGGCSRIAGYDRDGRGLLLSDRVEPARKPDGSFKPLPMIDYYNALVEALGCPDPGTQMELPTVPEAQEQARRMWKEAGLQGHHPVVMINPGGSFGPAKMWEPQRYARLADALVGSHGARIVLNAAPSEKPIARRVEQAMSRPPAISFARRNNSLPLLRALASMCDLMVTNDTGARHFGVATGSKVVTLFGSTDPRWTHLYTSLERIVRVELPCSPCQQRICPQPAGPLYHKCMFDISVEQVFDVCCELLSQPVEAST